MANNDSNPTEFVSPDGRFSFRQYLGDDGIVYLSCTGYEDEESAKAIMADLREVHSRIDRRYPLCIDLAELKEMTPEARRLWGEFAFAGESVLQRVAAHGGSFFMRGVINFYARIAKMQVRVFKTQTEAVSWLKTESTNEG